jgi:AcrR family transcriptional regulator
VTRPYKQQARAQAAAERRDAVLEAARELIVERGYPGLSLDVLAHDAAVARRTLYNQFSSKRALLEALLDSAATRAGAGELAAAAADPNAAEAARKLLARSCEFWAADRLLFRRLIGLSAVDDEVGVAVQAREERRTAVWRKVCRRLEEEHLLIGIGEVDAVRVLVHLSSFSAFDALADSTGTERVARLVILLARGVASI